MHLPGRGGGLGSNKCPFYGKVPFLENLAPPPLERWGAPGTDISIDASLLESTAIADMRVHEF